MKKVLIAFAVLLLSFSLFACGSGSAQKSEATAEIKNEPKYIWTIGIDDTESREYGTGQLTANYTVHLSASMEGGDSPDGNYRGELRIDYEGVPDSATLLAVNLLGGSFDFEGWGENDAFEFCMEPYDHESLMSFVAEAYRGAGAKTAPLLDGIAMYTASSVEWTKSDWSMGLNAGLSGVFGIDASGDESGGFADVYTPFGSGSASADAPLELCYSIHFIDENTAQLNIWSHGDLDVDLSFTGTLDKTPLNETIKVD